MIINLLKFISFLAHTKLMKKKIKTIKRLNMLAAEFLFVIMMLVNLYILQISSFSRYTTTNIIIWIHKILNIIIRRFIFYFFNIKKESRVKSSNLVII